MSDSIPHKSHYVILHSSTDIKSDPLFKPHNTTEFSTFLQLLQDIIWIIFIKLSEHQLTDRLWITEILFTNVKCENIFFYYKNIFSMKIICSWNNGKCNEWYQLVFSQQLWSLGKGKGKGSTREGQRVDLGRSLKGHL